MVVDVLGSGVDVPSRKLAGLGKGVCDPPWFKRRNERRRRASGVSNRRVRGLVGKSPNTLHRSLAMELRRQRASPSGCRWSTPALPYREGTTDTGRVATRSACRKAGTGLPTALHTAPRSLDGETSYSITDSARWSDGEGAPTIFPTPHTCHSGNAAGVIRNPGAPGTASAAPGFPLSRE